MDIVLLFGEDQVVNSRQRDVNILKQSNCNSDNIKAATIQTKKGEKTKTESYSAQCGQVSESRIRVKMAN